MQAGKPLYRQAPLALCLFGILSAYYMMKPVRDALLIHRAGVEALPFALVLQAVAAFATVGLLNLLASRLQRRTFVGLTMGSFPVAGGLLLASMGWKHPTGAAVFAVVFYVWTTVFIVAALSTVWSIAASRVSVTEGRRSYLVVALASPVGAVVGAWISGNLVPRFGLQGSMAAAVTVLAGVALLSAALTPPGGRPFDREASGMRAAIEGVARVARGHPMLRAIAMLVVFASCTWAVMDRQVYYLIDARELGEVGTGAFFGQAYTRINQLTLALQVGLLAWVRRGFDPLVGIAVLPVTSLLVAIGALVGAPEDFWIVSWGVFAAVSYSVNHTSREMLYLGMSDDQKYRAKAAIDVFVLRASEGAGGLLLVGLAATGEGVLVSAAVAALALGWLATVRRVRQLGRAG